MSLNREQRRILERSQDKSIDRLIREKMRQSVAETGAAKGIRREISKTPDGKSILMDIVQAVPMGQPGETMAIPYAALRIGDSPAHVLWQSPQDALVWISQQRGTEHVRALVAELEAPEPSERRAEVLTNAKKHLETLDRLLAKMAPPPSAETAPSAEAMVDAAMKADAYDVSVKGYVQPVEVGEDGKPSHGHAVVKLKCPVCGGECGADSHRGLIVPGQTCEHGTPNAIHCTDCTGCACDGCVPPSLAPLEDW